MTTSTAINSNTRRKKNRLNLLFYRFFFKRCFFSSYIKETRIQNDKEATGYQIYAWAVQREIDFHVRHTEWVCALDGPGSRCVSLDPTARTERERQREKETERDRTRKKWKYKKTTPNVHFVLTLFFLFRYGLLLEKKKTKKEGICSIKSAITFGYHHV